MSNQFDSEQGLFEDSGSESRLKQFNLSPRSGATDKGHRRISSFGLALPKRPNMPPKGKAPAEKDASGAESSGYEEESPKGPPPRDDTPPRPRTPVPPPRQQQGSVLGIGASVPGKSTLVRVIKGKEVDFWNQVASLQTKALEDVLSIAKTDSAYSMRDFIDDVSYQGFDRDVYISAALKKISVKLFCQFAVLGALRGSNFEKIKETSPNLPQELSNAYNSAGFVKKPKKREDLTILRCTASIPHWCAYWFLATNVPKKMSGEPCQSLIQFPGAASVPMSSHNRLEHLNFCQSFSALLPGGEFNVNIYATAYENMVPIDKIPVEVRSALGISSMAEAKLITPSEIHEKYGSKAVVKVGKR